MPLNQKDSLTNYVIYFTLFMREKFFWTDSLFAESELTAHALKINSLILRVFLVSVNESYEFTDIICPKESLQTITDNLRINARLL